MTRETRRTLPSEAQMRAAVASRDRAFDGVFLYGVVTTGVFCVPSCRSRAARPENLRFFLDADEAERAGLRPCKRCRPREAAARRERLVETARFIQENAARRLPLAELAERMDLGPSSFQRLFKETFGVSPKAYQDAARLARFKSSLRAGEGVAEAVFEAGFGSTSRVYGEAARSLGMTPSVYRAGGAGETIFHACRQTALGSLLLAATPRGVCFAQLGEDAPPLLERLRAEFPAAELVASRAQASPELDRWIEALDAHLSQGAPRPDLPLDLRGTAFQIRVWRYLLEIPEGDVQSYGEVAAGVGRPKAVRAAASACAANRIAVLVPCHRVLRGDGQLGGYRWGLARKRALIDLERARQRGTR